MAHADPHARIPVPASSGDFTDVIGARCAWTRTEQCAPAPPPADTRPRFPARPRSVPRRFHSLGSTSPLEAFRQPLGAGPPARRRVQPRPDLLRPQNCRAHAETRKTRRTAEGIDSWDGDRLAGDHDRRPRTTGKVSTCVSGILRVSAPDPFFQAAALQGATNRARISARARDRGRREARKPLANSNLHFVKSVV
jgi:hypothetical protein